MPGDVQGNTTNVISNQQGADINHDGNDKKILQEGAEKETDEHLPREGGVSGLMLQAVKIVYRLRSLVENQVDD